MKILRSYLALAGLCLTAGTAQADVCDYTPSKLAATAIGTAAAGVTAATGVGMKVAGFYTLVNAGSGLTMIGSTAAGASAAGTVGIIAGTGGVAGTAASILMAPVTIAVGGIAVVGGGIFEGACYFQVVRVTDPYEVRKIIESIASEDATISIVATDDGDAMRLIVEDETNEYLLRNLYIADGLLKHRDFGPNTTIGPVLFTSNEPEK